MEAWRFVPRVLGHSDYGFFWQLRVGAWLFMLGTMLWFWRRSWSGLPSWLLLIASLGTALFISATGHAGEDGIWSIPNMINWLHSVSTSLWGGMVILYAGIVLPALREGASPEQTSIVSTRLSTFAAGALVLVVLSGVFNSWRQLNGIDDLWSTEYGRILLIKLGLVAVMTAIGALNRFHLVPQMERWQDKILIDWEALSYRFLQVLRLDSIVFITILIAAVVLSMQSPPAHGQG